MAAERIDDSSDIMPDDPTATVQEVDYRPSSDKGTVIRPSLTATASLTKPDADEKKKDQRSTFTGVVVDLGDNTKVPREYKVLRQDLKLGLAYCYGVEKGYNEYRIGDEVSLTASELQGIWIIIGAPKKLPLPTLTARATGSGPGEEVEVKYSVIQHETGFDETFTLDTDTGEITVKCDKEIVVELLIQCVVTVSATKPKQTVNVITGLRLSGDFLQVQITEVQLYTSSVDPYWINEIDLTACSGY